MTHKTQETIKTIRQPDDYSGPVVCTVISSAARRPCGMAVLYIHGFSDYYFNSAMCAEFNSHGYDFYAVDLRKYGRSILPGQKMFQARDLHEYFPDIIAGLDEIRRNKSDRRIILMGHSTGGLICSLFMAECPQPDICALILNSPFLSWNLPFALRKFAVPAISLLSRIAPGTVIRQPKDASYARTLHRDLGGEWDYDRELKPDELPDVDAGWIAAIERAQRRLRHGAGIKVPILLLHSDRSVRPGASQDEFRRGDAILNVETLAEVGRRLGPDVTEVAIPGGLHDLVLSAPKVRENVYREIFSWLTSHVKPK